MRGRSPRRAGGIAVRRAPRILRATHAGRVQTLEVLRRLVLHEHRFDAAVLLREVEHRVEATERAVGVGAAPRVAADQLVVAVEAFTEDEEVLLAERLRFRAHAVGKRAPKATHVARDLRTIDVLDRIDAEAIEVGDLDPVLEHADQRFLRVRVVGVEILEPAREVARGLLRADEVLRVVGLVPPHVDATLAVVPARIVEPRLALVPVEPLGRARRRRAVLVGPVGEANVRAAGEAERGPALHAARVVVRIPLDDALEVARAIRAVRHLVAAALRGIVAADLQARVREAAAADRVVGLAVAVDVVIEELAHVVRDHIEDHEHPLLVRFVDELAQLGEIAEVSVGAQEVLRPVAVVAREPGVLFGVLHDRRDPQRGHAERVQVIELVDHALPIAAVIAAGDRRRDVDVVVRIPVGEPVDHDLVDDLIAPIQPSIGLVGAVGGVIEVRRATARGY